MGECAGLSKCPSYKDPITTNRSVVTGGFRRKNSENMGFFCTKPRLRPFSAAYIGCKQPVLESDMHSMEGIELYLGREGIL